MELAMNIFLVVALVVMMVMCKKMMTKGGGGCCGHKENSIETSPEFKQLEEQLQKLEAQNKQLKNEMEKIK